LHRESPYGSSTIVPETAKELKRIRHREENDVLKEIPKLNQHTRSEKREK